MMSVADTRWDRDAEHRPESVLLVKLIHALDTDDTFNLKMGGDGDQGETLAYLLDELIESGKIELRIK